ncbi:MAG: hydroxymethylglutaryl-CoA synthase family protein [Acidimicrobiia bacterium]|nr:hydroxymethylglutaryl-CoA synthase family protein [Acidimicrobiia bacterium]
MATRGIVGAAVYLPHRRLDRTTMAAISGGGGGRGTRTVAGYDEDTTTMGVEAARAALRPLGDVRPQALWFSTVAPAYADKTNATTIHAALRLPTSTGAFDANGSVRSAVGALRAALAASGPQVVVSADLRAGLPGGADEATFGDGAAALVIADADTAPVLAEVIGWGCVTEEFLDRWRIPGEDRSRTWEERFGETRYLPLGVAAWEQALGAAEQRSDQIDHIIITGTSTRANAALAKKLAVGERRIDDLGATVGNTGAAHPALLLTAALEVASPGQVIALIVLADGADVMLVRTTDALAAWAPSRPLAPQVAAGGEIAYGTYLRWRGLLPVEPPRRPEPARPSASAAARSADWKFGFVGSSSEGGPVHLPPQPGDDGAVPMADASGTIVTFTVDRLAYSPSPPVVFAVVDFDGGGRLPVELTDVDIDQVRIGGRVEPTFRKLFTADGIHNYFWKARMT